jgi:hypothetical protein
VLTEVKAREGGLGQGLYRRAGAVEVRELLPGIMALVDGHHEGRHQTESEEEGVSG